MAAMRSATRRPLRQFNEHMAGVGEDEVGSQFGPLPGRISLWAKNKVVHLSMLYNFYLGVIVIGDLI
jgi:hypothetical protein